MPGTGGESKTSVRRLKGAERARIALDLRTTGATFAQVGQALGITPQAAHKLVTRALKNRMDESVDHYRKVLTDRVEAIVMSNWQQRAAPRVADTILRAMELGARLTGAEKVAPAVNVTVNADQPRYDTSRLTSDEKRALATLLARTLAPAAPPPATEDEAATAQVLELPTRAGQPN